MPPTETAWFGADGTLRLSGCQNIGTGANNSWPGNWNTTVNGFYTYTLNTNAYGLNGSGVWSVTIKMRGQARRGHVVDVIFNGCAMENVTGSVQLRAHGHHRQQRLGQVRHRLLSLGIVRLRQELLPGLRRRFDLQRIGSPGCQSPGRATTTAGQTLRCRAFHARTPKATTSIATATACCPISDPAARFDGVLREHP